MPTLQSITYITGINKVTERMTNKSEKPLYGDIITRLPCYKASEGKAMVFILERQLPGNYTTVNSEINSKN